MSGTNTIIEEMNDRLAKKDEEINRYIHQITQLQKQLMTTISFQINPPVMLDNNAQAAVAKAVAPLHLELSRKDWHIHILYATLFCSLLAFSILMHKANP